MFVGALDVLYVFSTEDYWQPAIYRLRLKTRVADGFISFCVAHDRGENEQSVLPLTTVDTLALFVKNPTIVSVHKRIRSALELVVHT